jgi:UDP-N-acetylmuramate--alanine ligase
MTNKNRKVSNKNDVIMEVLKSDATVFVTIGAGDIGAMVVNIKEALHEKV